MSYATDQAQGSKEIREEYCILNYLPMSQMVVEKSIQLQGSFAGKQQALARIHCNRTRVSSHVETGAFKKHIGFKEHNMANAFNR